MFDLKDKKSGENILGRMQDQIHDLYANLKGSFPQASSYFTSSPLKMIMSPRVNITEDKTHLIVTAELPGVDKDDIHLSIENEYLVISCEKKYSKESDSENFHHVEHGYGSIKRSVKLPNKFEQDSIDAEFKNGLLEVKLQKVEESSENKRSISIK